MEKAPERRHPGAESLMADIERYRTGFPVVARPAAGAVLLVVAGLSLAAVLRSDRMAERQRVPAQVRFGRGRELPGSASPINNRPFANSSALTV
jgi:hypothetical protein